MNPDFNNTNGNNSNASNNTNVPNNGMTNQNNLNQQNIFNVQSTNGVNVQNNLNVPNNGIVNRNNLNDQSSVSSQNIFNQQNNINQLNSFEMQGGNGTFSGSNDFLMNNTTIMSNTQPDISKKNKPITLIIFLVIVIALVIGGGIFFFINKDKFLKDDEKIIDNSGNEVKEDKKEKGINTSIKKIYIGFENAVALDEKGDLYVVGDGGYGWGGLEKVDEITLVASNVKDFFSGGDFYIDNESNLYVSGVDGLHGGVFDKYEKVGENIKKADGSTMGFMALSNEGELYAYGTQSYSGIGKRCEQLTKIEGITGVKDFFYDISSVYYINEDNELYGKPTITNEPFVKMLDNVEDISNYVIKTFDGKYYEMKYGDYKISLKYREEANGNYLNYFTKDGKTIDKNYAYPDDVKEFLKLFSVNYRTYYVYLDKNDELVLGYSDYKDGKDNFTVYKKSEYVTNSIKDIVEFLDFLYDRK